MSDIVERLRVAAEMRDELQDRYWHRASALKREAANEIERLRAELAQARSTALEEAAKTVENLTFPDGGNPIEAAIVHAGKIVCRNAAAAIRALREEE